MKSSNLAVITFSDRHMLVVIKTTDLPKYATDPFRSSDGPRGAYVWENVISKMPHPPPAAFAGSAMCSQLTQL